MQSDKLFGGEKTERVQAMVPEILAGIGAVEDRLGRNRTSFLGGLDGEGMPEDSARGHRDLAGILGGVHRHTPPSFLAGS